jgi:hypothetical protein
MHVPYTLSQWCSKSVQCISSHGIQYKPDTQYCTSSFVLTVGLFEHHTNNLEAFIQKLHVSLQNTNILVDLMFTMVPLKDTLQLLGPVANKN